MSKSQVERALSSKVAKRSEIMSAKEVGVPYLIHISDNPNIKKFEPFITRRMLESEDRTTPRISCSSNLAGAIGSHSDTDRILSIEDHSGWFKIYGIEYEFAVKPSGHLVADAPYHDEYWLIRYSPETEVYNSVTLGKFFYQEAFSRMNRTHKATNQWVTIIEVVKDKLQLTKEVELKRGFHRVVLEAQYIVRNRFGGFESPNVVSKEEITKSEWKRLIKESDIRMESRQINWMNEW